MCCLLLLSSCSLVRGLGGRPSQAELRQFSALHNHDGQAFVNRAEFFNNQPPFPRKKISFFAILRFLLARPAHTRPESTLPVADPDLAGAAPATPEVTWFGHSTVFVRAGGARILFDPVFGASMGPYPGAMRAFSGTEGDPTDAFPQIDAVVISHDHYDHLDYATLRRLRKKIRRIVAPLGVASHLRQWGFADSVIRTVNWYDSVSLNPQATIVATPAYHRSGRRFSENETLWASYVLQVGSTRIYFSGDTGYSGHFTAIGRRYGPFDLALLECGQYNEKWPRHHMFPEQTAQAGADLKARVLLPIHWAKYAESEHPWNEPITRLLQARPTGAADVVVPLMGQPYQVGAPFQQLIWWERP